jgi:hypothetical protein
MRMYFTFLVIIRQGFFDVYCEYNFSNVNRLISLIVLLCFFSNSFAQQSIQPVLKKKQRVQKRIQPFIAAYASMDAEGFYFGPSFSGGLVQPLTKKISVTGFVHYFKARVNDEGDLGAFDKGTFRLISFVVMPELKFGRKVNKGFFIGAGIAYQLRKQNYASESFTTIEDKAMFLPAVKLGWRFPLPEAKSYLSFELFGTGPYSYEESYNLVSDNSYTMEALTQLSAGFRLVF